jgi:exosortase
MAPIPTAWYEPLAIRMQQITSATSALLLEVCQVPVFREGYFIHLPGYDMEVGAACSGLRQLAAMFALGLCIGHVAGRGRGYTVALGLLSLPIAVAANCFRVVLTGFILMWFGREAADGVFHELEGLAVVGVAAAMMLATAWLLSKFGSQAAASDSGK